MPCNYICILITNRVQNYDITYDEALAGSSSDDENTKKSEPAAGSTVTKREDPDREGDNNSSITDHFSRTQKKTMDM